MQRMLTWNLIAEGSADEFGLAAHYEVARLIIVHHFERQTGESKEARLAHSMLVRTHDSFKRCWGQ